MRLENKPELRRFFLKQRREQPRAEKAAADRGISERLLTSAVFARAQCVFCYVSTPDEIDTHGILRQALAEGKTVCVPRCIRAGEMRAYHIASLDGLRTGRFGILEPDASAPEVLPERIDLIVAPALACDRAGVPPGLRRRILRPLYDTDAGRSGRPVRGGAFVGAAAAHGVRSALRLDFYRKAGAAHG